MRRAEKRLTDEQARDILARAEYGSLATIDGHGRPYVIPMSFAAKEDAIYLHCAIEGSKLDNIAANTEVGFTAVAGTKVLPKQFSTAYESAVVQGRAVLVKDADEKRGALMLLAEKYSTGFVDTAPAYIDKSFDKVGVIRIDIYKLTGKGSKTELLD